MKHKADEEIKDLRPRKHSGGEKKISTHETKGLARFKHIVVWIVVIAFIGTSGLMLIGIGSQKEAPAEKSATVNPAEQAQKKAEADLKFWQDQIREEPENSQNYFNLADTYQKAGKEDEAIENFKKALELDPKNTLAMKYLASLYAARKDYKQSDKYLKDALKANPDDAKVYELLANLAQIQKNTPLAITHMKTAVEKDPGNSMYYAYLASLHMTAKDKDSARKALNDGMEIAKTRHDRQGQAVLQQMLTKLDAPPKKEEKKETPKAGATTTPSGEATPAPTAEATTPAGEATPAPTAEATTPAGEATPAPTAEATTPAGEATPAPAGTNP